MSLKELVDNTRTDKNTLHSYLDVYDPLFLRLKDTAKNVLEVGVSDGGSLKLWFDYFTRANVWAVDSCPVNPVWADILCKERVHILTGLHAYCERTVGILRDMQVKYDMILDDATHTPDDQVYFVKNYLPFLTDTGVFVVEDVPTMEAAYMVLNAFPERVRPFVEILDRRALKNRSDDILVILDMARVTQ